MATAPASSRPTGAPSGAWFANQPIGRRLGIGFGAVTLLLVVTGVFGIMRLSSANSHAQSLKVDGLDATVDLLEAKFSLTDAHTETGDVAAAARRELDLRMDRYLSAYVLPDNVLAAGRAAQTAADTWAQMVDSGAPTADIEVAFKAAEQAMVDSVAINDADNQAILGRLDSAYAVGRNLLILLVVLGTGLAAGLALVIARSVTRPIDRMVGVLDRVAGGDLTARAEVTTTDEIGAMGASLDRALAETQEAIGAIADAAVSLAASAEELSANAAQVSSNISTVATGTEEMSASVREIASSAAEASSTASTAVGLAVEASSLVSQLAEASREIGTVVELITSIADQTNLLALNATIEAARAGDAGRGFAVVANEVKDLAQETSKATDSIRSTVEIIQERTASASSAIGEVANVIGAIDQSQSSIAGAVEEQTITANEMARQLAEASSGAEAISGSDGRTGSGSAADLAAMATELQATVARFTY